MTFLATTKLMPILLLLLGGGEHERGLQLYREGKFAEAAAAFRAAIRSDGDSAELQWNLALACFAAGDLDGAETAAEKYAALGRDARPDLHLGMLGAVRHAQAKQKSEEVLPKLLTQGEDPMPLLEAALAKANEARDYYGRAAEAAPQPELLRNLERSQRLAKALETRIELLKKLRDLTKQESEQKDDEKKNPDDKKSDEKKPDEKKPDEKKSDDKKSDQDKKPDDKGDQGDKPEQQPGEQKPGEQGEPPPSGDGAGEQPPEPKAPPEPKDGKKPGESGEPKPAPDPAQAGKDAEPNAAKGDGKDGKPASAAPGEGVEGKELTPEQAQQLFERLQQLDGKLRAIRARAKSGRPPVERDW